MNGEISTDTPDPVFSLAIEIFFSLPDGWVPLDLDAKSVEYADAVQLLINGGLFEGRRIIDAERNGNWLRAHGWQCGPLSRQKLLFELGALFTHIGWADGNKYRGSIAYIPHQCHAVRYSKFGIQTRQGLRGRFKNIFITTLIGVLTHEDRRPDGQFRIERHGFLKEDPGAVAVAQAAASASVGDIVNNVHVHNHTDNSGMERLFQEFLEKQQSTPPASTAAVRDTELSVDEALKHPEPFKPHSESLRVITEAFRQHCENMKGKEHAHRAAEWRRLHPSDPRTDERLKKASKRYPYTKPSKAE